jgi:hypothetical protein
MRWTRQVARRGEERQAYKILVGKLEGKRPLVRPRRRWENKTEAGFKGIGLDWIHLTQDMEWGGPS